MNELARSTPPESFGRYLLYPAIARGGMATVHTARLVGAEGFTRLVAAKRLHPQYTDDPEFVTMFHDEACIASRIHHPNVVPVLDVVVAGNGLVLVQEYVHGVPLSQLLKAAQSSETPVPTDIVIALLIGVLAGLHAAHEAKDESGHLLEIVHRDVSPQNVMVSVDGIPRLLDFGIAKARTSTHHTREGVFKGKLSYMAPELLRMEPIDRTVDLYATGVVAWEMLVNRRIYDGRHEMAFVTAVMGAEIPSLTAALADKRDAIGEERWKDLVALESIVGRAMSVDSEARFATADDMLRALLEVRVAATSMAVAEWVRSLGADFIEQREKLLAANEESWRRTKLCTPGSGTHRAAASVAASVSSAPPSQPSHSTPPPRKRSAVTSDARETIDAHEPTSSMPSVASTSTPLVITFPSGVSTASSSFRLAVCGSPAARLSRLVRALRVSPLTPWAAAGLVLLALVLGSVVRAGSEAATPESPNMLQVTSFTPWRAATATAAATTTSSVAGDVALSVAAPGSPVAAPLPGAAPSASSSAAVPLAAGAVAVVPAPMSPPRPQLHWSPPPRAVAPWRPAPALPSAQPSASAKVDCNLPFFFEGTKKVFKPSCL
jgi:serine/threonine-protein kinase